MLYSRRVDVNKTVKNVLYSKDHIFYIFFCNNIVHIMDRLSKIIFIGYELSQNIGKPKNLKVLWSEIVKRV